ncbi:MAG: hypothetical protein EAZ97_02050 [Bacteroidetes bacterium]|nr:MAG: hypothetical protein EAZ97_02050 [Bacteroidota bacterium]
MRITDLKIKNIGAFSEAKLNFIDEDNPNKTPITLITGENGSGKTIILDAIRAMLWQNLTKLDRDIVRNKENFEINMNVFVNGKSQEFVCNQHGVSTNIYFSKHFSAKIKDFRQITYDWILNYWTSKTDNKALKISKITNLDPNKYLVNVLSGIQPNIQVIELITFFDYLKSSENRKEQKEGEFLMEKVKKIIQLSLFEGEFLYVERKSLTPLVKVGNKELSLEKLSSGNLYLIQRLMALLGQMYAVYQINSSNIEKMCDFQGVLLIDEAENHLHPKWQKTFLKSILNIFPNLQIIATTHSPFIVASVENAKVFVCESRNNQVEIIDRSAEYSSKPVDEILVSEIFGTQPFSFEITDLLEKRKKAIRQGNQTERQILEDRLSKLNPEYFSYFGLEKKFPNLKF